MTDDRRTVRQTLPAEDNPQSTFTSAAGTVLATAGVAIGLGNIWRFPYMMGKYGGAVFLLVYLVIIVAFGIPALMAEWSLGRHTRRGTWAAFHRAGLPGAKWWSRLLLITVTMAASYYGVVLAYVLNLASASVAAGWRANPADPLPALSSEMPVRSIYVLITVLLSAAALGMGVKRGIERVSKVALPMFFAIFMILIVRVLTLEGAMDGLTRFLVPKWSDFTPATPLAAMGQAFFSLGLGGTFMVVYGSYLRDGDSIPRLAVGTAAADVGAALLAGMIIVPAAFAVGVAMDAGPGLIFGVMPAVFAQMPADVTAALMAGLIVMPAAFVFGIEPGSGPTLMFEVMPRVFAHIPGGHWFGALFFISVYIVAMLSLMAAYEVTINAVSNGLSWTRRRTILCLVVVQLLLAIPAMLYDNYIEYSDLFWGATMQPVGGAIAVIALTWCIGRTRTLEEFRRNAKLRIPTWLFYWLKFGVPVGIVATLVYGWADSRIVRELLNR